MRTSLVVGLSVLMLAPSMQAQEKGTWEIGGFGRYTRYPSAFDSVSQKSENSFGGGGRLGWFFAKNWSLEADASYNATDLDGFRPGTQSSGLGYVPIHLRGIYNVPLGGAGNAAFLIGGGVTWNHYDKLDATDKNDFGVGGLVGVRARLYRRLFFRVDGTADFTPNTLGTTSGEVFLGAQAGLSLLLGGTCSNRLESISLSPATASLFPGQTQQFQTTGRLCDGSTTTPAIVVYTGTGGTVSTGGNFTAGTAPGSYMVIAQSGKYADTSVVTVRANNPVALTLTPPQATLDTGGTQLFTATLRMADGTTRPVTAMTATGGSITNGSYQAGNAAGTYRVIASEGNLADTSAVTIRPPPEPPVNIILRGAVFEFDKFTLTAPAQDTLRRVAGTLTLNPTVRIEIAGHTDARGTNAYNLRLSQARAEAVQQFLVANGVAADRMTVTFFGEDRPVASNNTDAGRAENRRVEISRRP